MQNEETKIGFMNKKYLYGFAIKGIQKYIFETNKLTEIAGGSALIEEISTTIFSEFLQRHQLAEDVEVFQQAAGNIKCIATKKAARLIYEQFPEEIRKKDKITHARQPKTLNLSFAISREPQLQFR